MAQSVLVGRIKRPAAIDVYDNRRKGGRSGNRRGRLRDGTDPSAMRVMRGVDRMRDARVMVVMAIMMGLGGRAGEEKGRTGNQSRRRQTNKLADSRAIVTQRHERALFNFTQRLRLSRSPLRNSHGRKRYVGAVTRRLTRGPGSDGVVRQVSGIAASRSGQRFAAMKR